MFLKILHGTETLAEMVCLDSGTKTAILDEAMAIYARRIHQYQVEEKGWKRACFGKLLSVQMERLNVNLSTYDANDLTFLTETISNTSIPIFTVEMLSEWQYAHY